LSTSGDLSSFVVKLLLWSKRKDSLASANEVLVNAQYVKLLT
jgi:hypothetical protein